MRDTSLDLTFAAAAASPGDDVSQARAREYDLLAALLFRAPRHDLLRSLAQLTGDASPLGLAHMALAEAARETTADDVAREYFNLFIGVGRGELLPYASYYLTGFLHERPLASVRADMVRLGMSRAVGPGDPEDHIAFLCEMMAGLIEGRFSAPPGADSAFFARHVAPWAARFFGDLERADAAVFYKAAARLGGLFVEIESEAFALAE